MGARYYDPSLNRFVSADTIVPGAGNPQALNRYSYTNGIPMATHSSIPTLPAIVQLRVANAMSPGQTRIMTVNKLMRQIIRK